MTLEGLGASYASRARRCGASLFDGFLLLAPTLAPPAFAIVGGGPGRGWDGYAVLLATAWVSAGSAVVMLSLQSFLLATHGVTFGMALLGIRFAEPSRLRGLLAPALATALPVVATLAFFALRAASEGATYRSAVENLEESVAWMPGLFVGLNGLSLLASRRSLLDWIAGGRARATVQEPRDLALPARRSMALDSVLMVVTTLPSLAGFLLVWGRPGALPTLGVCAAIPLIGLAIAQAHSRASTGETIGRRAIRAVAE